MIQRSFTQISILFGQALRGLSSGARVFEVTIQKIILIESKYTLKNLSLWN